MVSLCCTYTDEMRWDEIEGPVCRSSRAGPSPGCFVFPGLSRRGTSRSAMSRGQHANWCWFTSADLQRDGLRVEPWWTVAETKSGPSMGNLHVTQPQWKTDGSVQQIGGLIVWLGGCANSFLCNPSEQLLIINSFILVNLFNIRLWIAAPNMSHFKATDTFKGLT